MTVKRPKFKNSILEININEQQQQQSHRNLGKTNTIYTLISKIIIIPSKLEGKQHELIIKQMMISRCADYNFDR